VCMRAGTGVVTIVADGGGATACVHVGTRDDNVVIVVTPMGGGGHTAESMRAGTGVLSALVPATRIIVIAVHPCGYPGTSLSSICPCDCMDHHRHLSLRRHWLPRNIIVVHRASCPDHVIATTVIVIIIIFVVV